MEDELSEEARAVTGDRAILNHTARVVTAYLERNELTWDMIPEVVLIVGRAFRDLRAGGVTDPQPEHVEFRRRKVIPDNPVVPREKLVTHDQVSCACCGFTGKTLKRHLWAEHGLTPADYLAHYHLPLDLKLTAPAYSETRSNWAKQSRLGQVPWGKTPTKVA